MHYIEQADIENSFGADNVRIWSNLSGDVNETDEARVLASILYAEDMINSRFRGGKYAVPFASPSALVKNWCARLAGFWLFESRPKPADESKGENFLDVKEAVMSEISQCLAGIMELDSLLVATKGGPAVVGNR
jgi:phage gp36-like protein